MFFFKSNFRVGDYFVYIAQRLPMNVNIAAACVLSTTSVECREVDIKTAKLNVSNEERFNKNFSHFNP